MRRGIAVGKAQGGKAAVLVFEEEKGISCGDSRDPGKGSREFKAGE